MTKYLLLSSALLMSLLFSCHKATDVIPATDPNAPARTAQEAKTRLTAQSKWAIDEILSNGKLLFKRGQTNPKEADMELEWCQFTQNGLFTVKSIGNSTLDKFFYKLDQVNNRILISDNEQFKNAGDWTIKAGSVYTTRFDMESKDGNETLYFKLVALME